MDNSVFNRIVNAGKVPSNADLAELMASIGAPGDKRAEKREAVSRLFDEMGYRATNIQGAAVADGLTLFKEF